jgi:hypothetical protein
MKDGHVSDILALVRRVVKSTDCKYSTIPSTTARWREPYLEARVSMLKIF